MSSSEEDISMLRDAVDPQFASSYVETGLKTSQTTTDLKPSNRTVSDNEDHNDLGTTPEFRRHLAKKLSNFLDSQIKMTKPNGHLPDPGRESPPAEDFGIRLFSSSKIITSLPGVKEDPPETRKRPDLLKKYRNRNGCIENSSSSSSDEMDKLASVAVSSDWIISKQGVYDCTKPTAAAASAEESDRNVIKPNGCKVEGEIRSGGHHRNVCRKKKHKDTKEKERVNKRTNKDVDIREIPIKRKKHSKRKDRKLSANAQTD